MVQRPREVGSLSRVNQLARGSLTTSSVFTLQHWSGPASEPVSEPPNRWSGRGRREGPRELARRRVRLLLVKIQEATVNFLVRWLLLDESEREQRLGALPPEGSRRGAAHWMVGRKRSDEVTLAARKFRRRQSQSRLLLRDFNRLPDRSWRLLLRFLFRRWLTSTNVIELALLVLLAGCCLHQCLELLEDYYQYPTYVTATTVFNDDFRMDLPAVTVCDNNRISLSALRENFPQYNMSHFLAISLGTFQSVDNFSLVSPPSYNPQQIDWMYGDQLSTSTSASVSASVGSSSTAAPSESSSRARNPTFHDIDWIRVLKFFAKDKPSGHFKVTPSYDFIETLLCANVWGEQMPCSKLRRITTLQQASLCSTLFHESVFWDSREPAVKKLEQAIRRKPSTVRYGSQISDGLHLLEPEVGGAEPAGLGEEEEGEEGGNLGEEGTPNIDFANMEMIRIRINFNRNDYANKRVVVGGRFAVHSSSIVGEVTHKAYGLAPGNWYNYYIERFDYQRLPPPYSTKCYDYDSSRYVWLDRARMINSTRARVKRLIEEQARSPDRLIPRYGEVLKLRAMGKVSLAATLEK